MNFDHIEDTLRIQNKDIPVRIGMLPHLKLRFYADNPRIYSIVNADMDEPEQEMIESQLQSMEHVKVLIQDIKANGGLTDAIIVLEGTWEVLEGNSRLAAYRYLFSKKPQLWAHIKCVVLPESVKESQIFALLGQYHIKGKKDWAPFEQAGFLYRRHKNHGMDVDELAKEIGLPKGIADRYIKTYEFMLGHGDTNVSRWSYYEEFIKNNKIKMLRDKYPSFDDLIVEKIQSGEIKRAQDIRDKLPALSNAPKTAKKFVEGALSFEQAMDAVEDSGNADALYLKINRFRHWLVNESTEAAIKGATKTVQGKINYELSKVESQTKVLTELIK